MIVTVRLFAGVREAAGISRLEVELEEPATVADALRGAARAVPGAWRLPSTVMLAANGEYAKETARLNHGDEVAIIPPVSGGALATGQEQQVVITQEPLDPASLTDFVRRDADGAIVTFLGVTRDHNAGRRVLHLEYEAYTPMAERMMMRLITEMKNQFDIGQVAVATPYRQGRNRRNEHGPRR